MVSTSVNRFVLLYRSVPGYTARQGAAGYRPDPGGRGVVVRGGGGVKGGGALIAKRTNGAVAVNIYIQYTSENEGLSHIALECIYISYSE